MTMVEHIIHLFLMFHVTRMGDITFSTTIKLASDYGK